MTEHHFPQNNFSSSYQNNELFIWKNRFFDTTMKVKKVFLLFGSLLVVVIVFLIYSARDLSLYTAPKSNTKPEFQENKWLKFEDRLSKLEDNLNKHGGDVEDLKEAVHDMLQSDLTGQSPAFPKDVLYDTSCSFQVGSIPRVNIQMLDVYKQVKFDNPDGGVWKQGWRIEVDEKDWNRQNKLKVFVIPHSHNDPGWVKTFDEYYVSQTKKILNNMLVKLPIDPRRKFIWAEISYFAMWFSELNDEEKEGVKRLLNNNQLEIVTGGWVMNDEANSHFIGIVNQLIEGHQWLQQNLNYTPFSSWSIDPFGMSFAQAYFLKEAGLQNLLIQRTHYSIKKEFASKKHLEFRWRQFWDEKGKTDLLTHMMPFYSYDIPHTCGPDPKICCQFDFRRLPGHGFHCPWKIAPQPITEQNVAQKAELLLDQYRKKSKLYKTNVLLIPLGDDFRYDHPIEWNVQYENYERLFEYLNRNLRLNVQAQFGTLTDYFQALQKEQKMTEFPVLTGDFFTYSDRDDHYWSGYYTSRPFYKRMDRVLMAYVRAAETVHSLTVLSKKTVKNFGFDLLKNARQQLSLFQHHDGITGTAKDYVMEDYAKRMLGGIDGCQKVIQACVHLLQGQRVELEDTPAYIIDDIRHGHNHLAEQYQITIGPQIPSKKLVLFNPLTFDRTETVSFLISTPFVEVTGVNGRINCQISPVFEYGSTMSQTKYELSFTTKIGALGLVSYVVNAVNELPEQTKFAKVRIFNQFSLINFPKGFNEDLITSYPDSREFSVQNDKITATFNSMGLLKAVKNDGVVLPVHLDFATYGVRVRGNSEKSGAYLFIPDGEAKVLPIDSTIVNVIEGPVVSQVIVQLPYVLHVVKLHNEGPENAGIQIENTVDISKTNNFEIAMRLSTKINNSEDFYTDLNGYQIARRTRLAKLPIQANYYPMPTTAYIEDKNTRLTVLTASPLGCSSLQSGQIEIMLDRRLNQDDNLGLGQGVLDNVPTKQRFRVFFEHKKPNCKGTAEGHPAGFPSLLAHLNLQTLLNPVIKLIRTEDETDLYPAFNPGQPLTVDFSLTTLRSDIYHRGKTFLGFILHRQYVDVCFTPESLLKQYQIGNGTANISALLPIDTSKKLHKTSLTFNLVKHEVHTRSSVDLCPMEMQAFILK